MHTVNKIADNIGWTLYFQNGKLVWTNGSDSKLFIYDGQQRELSSAGRIWNVNLEGNQITWAQDNNGNAKVFLYNGTTAREIANYSNAGIRDLVINNGKLAWTVVKTTQTSSGAFSFTRESSSILYFYDGNQINEITNVPNDIWYTSLENGKIAWIEETNSNQKLRFYDGTNTREIASGSYIGLIGIHNGQIAWRQNDGTKLNKLCLFDGNQTITVADYGNGDPNYLAFYNGKLVYKSAGNQLYLYSAEQAQPPVVISDADKVVTPPQLDYEKLRNASEQQILDILNQVCQTMTADQKSDAESIETITRYCEFGISQILKSSVSIDNNQINLDKSILAAKEAKATETRAAIETILSKNSITLNRDLQTEVTLTADQWEDQAVTIIADQNLTEPATTIDTIRVEGQETGAVFTLATLKQDLAENGPISVQIEKETDSVAGTGQMVASLGSTADLLRYARGEQNLALKIKLPTFKVSIGNTIKKLKNNIKIVLPKSTGDVDYQAVFKIDGQKAEPIGGKYNQASKKIEIPIKETGRYYVAENQKNFSDITSKSAEVQEAIKVLAAKGIIKGRSDSSFDPDAFISRSEIAALMVKTLYKLDTSLKAGFTDVPTSSWYYNYAASAKHHNIISGYPDNTFRGALVINKEQITAICARTMREEKNYKQPSNPEMYLKYNDRNSIASWAKGDISLASREGLVVKRQDGNFLPSQGMTRADAAVVLYRLFNRL
ncbi:MAG: S-layer homology domain-containing protein [Syntrophomonadaceae bacterium]|jgi:hypothetical protein